MLNWHHCQHHAQITSSVVFIYFKVSPTDIVLLAFIEYKNSLQYIMYTFTVNGKMLYPTLIVKIKRRNDK